MATDTSITLINEVSDWVVSQALTKIDLEQLVSGTCERLAAAGVGIARVNFTFSVLHPLYTAMNFVWRRGQGVEVGGYRHVEGGTSSNKFAASPYYHLVSNKLPHMRQRLEGKSNFDYPVLEDLKEQGMTDYLVFMRPFEDAQGKGMFGSWATDRPGGFSDSEIAAILRIQKRLAVTAKVAVLGNLAENALVTYLGKNAGGRVLDGQIQRGDGETIRAAIVMGDIRGSTRMAETLGRQVYIDALNLFFDNVAGAFSDAGGEILSFVGDGFLAIFPADTNTATARSKACRAAGEAARVAVAQMDEANAQWMAEGHDEIGYGLGLHIGNVLFGNVGLADRLTFSAFGSAVNEAARLEALTKECNSRVIASEDFRSRCKGEWASMGKQCLRGVGHPIEIYKPVYEPSCEDKKCRLRTRETKPLSDAENIVLLEQRNSA